ncbi:MAG: DUF1249 domain-containing protein [Lysobacteraceae bacterium]|jgi:uncharacterized protein YqiB (DUF1249 family)|nr:DUF1249 domain-containing protein [Gammaproteobacteria bacterium]
MHLAEATTPTLPRASRFGYLMALYGENFDRFERMFLPHRCGLGHWRSSLGDGLDLHLHVMQQHRYTTEYRLTYDIRDPMTGEPDPSAFLRRYHDARVLEATHCYVGRRWQDVLGLHPSPQTLLGHRLQMNVFLGKWLEFLAEQGHSPHSLQRDPRPAQRCHETPPESRSIIDA